MATGYLRHIEVIILFLIVGSLAVDLSTLTECYIRKYKMRISKPFRTRSGTVLPCVDNVFIDSCWGRCDSSEVGDYRIPFRLSNHTVCTYGGIQLRKVKLRYCHPRHPNPFYTVFDATHCICSQCDPESTSCENLNG